MKKEVVVKKVKRLGKGVVALRDIKRGEIILRNDLTKLRKYTLKEISENSKLMKKSNHCDYAGHNKYVIDFSTESFVNHSCEPNSFIEFSKIGKTKLIAIRDIEKGEEITKDYTLSAIEQLRGNPEIYHWKMKCNCGSKNCRKIIHGNFFKMPIKFQREKYSFLPTWVKRKYRNKLKKLKVRT